MASPARGEFEMTTPILMIVLMTAPYLLAWAVSAARRTPFNARGAAATGLALLFFFTSIGHFLQTEVMAQMLPDWVPARVPLVYLTGILEIAIAIGFLVPGLRAYTGWLAAAVLVLFFPANIYAALNQVPMGGHAWGPIYLLVRAPVQLAIILWVYWFVIRPPRVATSG